MNKFLIVCSIMAVSLSPAIAGDWNGAGWYHVGYTSDGTYGGIGIYGGPFKDREGCLNTLPEDEDDGDIETIYECENLEEQPDYDKDGDE